MPSRRYQLRKRRPREGIWAEISLGRAGSRMGTPASCPMPAKVWNVLGYGVE